MNAIASRILFISPMFLVTATLRADEGKPVFPIRGPIPIYNYWIWGGIGVVLVLGIIGGLLWLRYRKKKEAEPIPEIPPQVEAMAALTRLKNTPWQGESKVFVSSVSEILRHYIERAFTIRALEQTTEEFMESATEHPIIGKAVAENLRDVIETGDLVKFASQSLDSDRAAHFIERAESFVTSTHNTRQAQLAAEAARQQSPALPTGESAK